MVNPLELPEELRSLIEKRGESDRREATAEPTASDAAEPEGGEERRVADRRAEDRSAS